VNTILNGIFSLVERCFSEIWRQEKGRVNESSKISFTLKYSFR